MKTTQFQLRWSTRNTTAAHDVVECSSVSSPSSSPPQPTHLTNTSSSTVTMQEEILWQLAHACKTNTAPPAQSNGTQWESTTRSSLAAASCSFFSSRLHSPLLLLPLSKPLPLPPPPPPLSFPVFSATRSTNPYDDSTRVLLLLLLLQTFETWRNKYIKLVRREESLVVVLVSNSWTDPDSNTLSARNHTKCHHSAHTTASYCWPWWWWWWWWWKWYYHLRPCSTTFDRRDQSTPEAAWS